MTDFSINRTSGVGGKNNSEVSNSEYLTLEKAFKEFLNSEFANYETGKVVKLELLKRLKEAAEKEGRVEEAKDAEAKIAELNAPKKEEEEKVSAYYSPVIHQVTPEEIDENRTKKVLDTFTDANGNVGNHTKEIAQSFTDVSAEQIIYFLKHCRNTEGNIPDDIAKTTVDLAKSGVSTNCMLYFLDKLAIPSDKPISERSIDSKMGERFLELKAKGTDENDAIKILSLLTENFEDLKVVEAAINKLMKAEVAPDALIEVVHSLGVKNNDKIKVSPTALDSVINLKKTLNKTRNNEKRDRDNPINQLEIMVWGDDKSKMIMKNNKVVYSTPAQGETGEDLKKKYSDYMSRIEDGLLLDFIGKFKQEDGEINPVGLRVFTSLRRIGMTFDTLMDSADFCLKNGKINQDNLFLLTKFKSVGALSCDILPMINAIKENNDGKLDETDVQNACDLTSAVIDADTVISLLPKIKNDDDIKDLVLMHSSLFTHKANLKTIADLAFNNDGVKDELAVDTLNSLAVNFLFKEIPDENMLEEKYLSNVKMILNEAKNPVTGALDDNSAGICAIMCHNEETPENIIKALFTCKNKEGVVDKDLADILWNMSLGGAKFEDIEDVLRACKNVRSGIINNTYAKTILSFYENCSEEGEYKNPTAEIIKMVLHKG